MQNDSTETHSQRVKKKQRILPLQYIYHILGPGSMLLSLRSDLALPMRASKDRPIHHFPFVFSCFADFHIRHKIASLCRCHSCEGSASDEKRKIWANSLSSAQFHSRAPNLIPKHQTSGLNRLLASTLIFHRHFPDRLVSPSFLKPSLMRVCSITARWTRKSWQEEFVLVKIVHILQWRNCLPFFGDLIP